MGSTRWKQGPHYNIHMVEGRTGAGGEGLLASSDQLGPPIQKYTDYNLESQVPSLSLL